MESPKETSGGRALGQRQVHERNSEEDMVWEQCNGSSQSPSGAWEGGLVCQSTKEKLGSTNVEIKWGPGEVPPKALRSGSVSAE